MPIFVVLNFSYVLYTLLVIRSLIFVKFCTLFIMHCTLFIAVHTFHCVVCLFHFLTILYTIHLLHYVVFIYYYKACTSYQFFLLFACCAFLILWLKVFFMLFFVFFVTAFHCHIAGTFHLIFSCVMISFHFEPCHWVEGTNQCFSWPFAVKVNSNFNSSNL